MASNPKDYSVAGATFAPFRLAWRVGLSMLLLWFVAVAMNIAWVRWHALEADDHMQQLIGYYVDRSSNTAFTEAVAAKAYWLAFEATAVQRQLAAPQSATKSDDKLGGAIKRSVWAAFRPEIRVAAYATILFGVKLAITALAAPLFLLLMGVAVCDGLVQRYIRKACGGHESAAIYHRAKQYGFMLLPPFAATVFLCAPVALDPAWVLIPTALISAVLLRLQATYYKKYL